MNSIILTSANQGCFGWLYHEHFKHRRRRFVDERNWTIPHDSYIERDQYDRHDTVYALVESNGILAGYARLLRTSNTVEYGRETFSYMVRDASRGILPGIRTDIFEKAAPPVDPGVWEMTRFHADNREVMQELFNLSAKFIKSENGHGTISYTRRSYNSILNRIGFPTRISGPIVRHSEDGHDYCVLSTALE